MNNSPSSARRKIEEAKASESTFASELVPRPNSSSNSLKIQHLPSPSQKLMDFTDEIDDKMKHNDLIQKAAQHLSEQNALLLDLKTENAAEQAAREELEEFLAKARQNKNRFDIHTMNLNEGNGPASAQLNALLADLDKKSKELVAENQPLFKESEGLSVNLNFASYDSRVSSPSGAHQRTPLKTREESKEEEEVRRRNTKETQFQAELEEKGQQTDFEIVDLEVYEGLREEKKRTEAEFKAKEKELVDELEKTKAEHKELKQESDRREDSLQNALNQLKEEKNKVLEVNSKALLAEKLNENLKNQAKEMKNEIADLFEKMDRKSKKKKELKAVLAEFEARKEEFEKIDEIKEEVREKEKIIEENDQKLREFCEKVEETEGKLKKKEEEVERVYQEYEELVQISQINEELRRDLELKMIEKEKEVERVAKTLEDTKAEGERQKNILRCDKSVSSGQFIPKMKNALVGTEEEDHSVREISVGASFERAEMIDEETSQCPFPLENEGVELGEMNSNERENLTEFFNLLSKKNPDLLKKALEGKEEKFKVILKQLQVASGGQQLQERKGSAKDKSTQVNFEQEESTMGYPSKASTSRMMSLHMKNNSSDVSLMLKPDTILPSINPQPLERRASQGSLSKKLPEVYNESMSLNTVPASLMSFSKEESSKTSYMETLRRSFNEKKNQPIFQMYEHIRKRYQNRDLTNFVSVFEASFGKEYFGQKTLREGFLSYSEFESVFKKVIYLHQPCGLNCLHLARFNQKIGFVPETRPNKQVFVMSKSTIFRPTRVKNSEKFPSYMMMFPNH